MPAIVWRRSMKPDILGSGFMTAWRIMASPVWLLLRVWSPRNMATGSKPIGGTVVNNLKSYAFIKKLRPEDNLFKINRTRAWKIIKAAARRRIPFPASPTFFLCRKSSKNFREAKIVPLSNPPFSERSACAD
jgi:hypothetical protein